MAYTTINKPNQHFDTTTYTANGGSQTITNSGSMQPDFFWGKVRSTTSNHILINSIAGVSKYLYSNTTGAETTDANYLTSFNANGFSLGSNNYSNGTTMVAWQWKGGGTGVSNTQGSITSTVSANTTSGFSIVRWNGNGTNGSTVGHGLGVAPSFYIVKDIGLARQWVCYHKSIGATGGINLSSTGAATTGNAAFWNNVSPTSSVFSVSTYTNENASNYITYCFAEVKGFSKFSSYTGNGSTDGTFVYTGFKPAFVMIKRDFAGYNWLMFDNKRQTTFNAIDDFLYADLSDSEVTGNANQAIDFVSNGFKCRGTGGSTNGSGGTFFYMAFAEQPLVGTNNVPCTAR